MIYLGTDLVYIPRIAQALDRFGQRFLNRVYTDQEQAACWRSSPSEAARLETVRPETVRPEIIDRLAARWAAKEAIVKALGTGWLGVGYRDVEIIRQASGAPTVGFHGRAIAVADSLAPPGRRCVWQVSFSHDRDYATATAIAIVVPSEPLG